MAGPYQKLLRKKLDLSSIGLIRQSNRPGCFCTPKNAKIIGWGGPDDIHFCFIRGFGETVFSVSPSEPGGNYIHPVARDFTDFLRLILTCGSTLPLEKVWNLTEDEFSELLWAQLPTKAQQRALDSLQAAFELSPMEQPYIYLRGLQAGFDYSRILYADKADDSYDGPARWRVCFPGHEGNRSRSGEEFLIAKEFNFNNVYYYIPSIYLCSAGLIIDVCSRSQAAVPGSSDCPDDDLLTLIPVANGKQLLMQSSSIEYWDSTMTGHKMPAALAHYCLDSSFCWKITRFAFPWATKRRPTIKSLVLNVYDRVPGDCTDKQFHRKHSPAFSFTLF